nr:Hsp33 family molecular chaperone HslO [bacterium]
MEQFFSDTGSVVHALACEEWAAVLLADTAAIVRRAEQIHGLSPLAAAALGRTLTMGTLMGVQLKDERERLGLDIRGEGPIGGIHVVAYPGGNVRGYVDCPEVELPLKPNGKLDVGGAIGEGTLTVTREREGRPPYQGKIALQTGEIAEDFAAYFAISQQQPSLVALGVSVSREAGVLAAGGVLIQPFPGCPDDVIERLEGLGPRLSRPGRLFAERSPMQVLEDLFPGDYRILATQNPCYACPCSKESMERALRLLGREELGRLIEEDGQAELTCHYCGRRYVFDEGALRALMQD